MINTKLFCKIFILLLLCQSFKMQMYGMMRPSGKRYFFTWWRGMSGAIHLLQTLNYHYFFRHYPVVRENLRRILWAYIINRGKFIIWAITIHFYPDRDAYNSILNGRGGNRRYLESVSEEQATEDAKILGESINSCNSHTSNFFEEGAESVVPIVCLNTESGNVPGKYVDMNDAFYVENGEIKKCEDYIVVPETILVYKHQPINYSCAPRGYSLETKEPLWNGVFFGEHGNILGSVNLDQTEITYIEGDEVKKSSTSFAVLC